MRALVGATLGLLLSSSALADPSVFLVDSPFDDASGVRQPTRVYRVDLGSGTLTLAADLGDTYTPVLGLAAANGTVLYGIGSDNSTDPSLNCFSCMLIKIVLDPGSTTPASLTAVGRLMSNGTTVHNFTAMSFRGNGDLYGISETEDILYRIDPDTAAMTEVGAFTVDSASGCSATPLDLTGGDLAFDALDRLWVWNNTPTSRGLWEVNPANACAVSSAACPVSRNLSGLVVVDHTNPSVTMRGPSANDERLYRVVPGVCPVNGEASSVLMKLNGLTFDHTRGDADSPYCEDDVSCDDGSACTADHCSTGGCLHDPVVCDDGNPCTTDTCDPVTGCAFVANLAIPEVTGLLVQQLGGGTTQLAWSLEQGPGVTYDLVSGSLAGGISSAVCLDSQVQGTQRSDLRPHPAAGTGYFYLVRAEGTCGVGTYGTDSLGQERHPSIDCP